VPDVSNDVKLRSILKDFFARQFDAGIAGRNGIAKNFLQAVLMEHEHLGQARIEHLNIRSAHGGVLLQFPDRTAYAILFGEDFDGDIGRFHEHSSVGIAQRKTDVRNPVASIGNLRP
jgi:hypothetical protein